MSRLDIHNNGHESVFIEYDGKMIGIDKEMQDIIKLLWLLDIKTNQSCQGNKNGYAWISFNGLSNANKFMNIVNGYKIKKWKFRTFIISDGIVNGYYCKYTNKQFIIKDYDGDLEKLLFAVSFPNNDISKIVDFIKN